MKIVSVNSLWLLIFFVVFSQTIKSQPESPEFVLMQTDSAQSAPDLENQAKIYKNQWNRDSLENAVRFYLKAAGEWNRSKNSDKYIECLRAAAELKNILGDKTNAAALYKTALKVSISAGNKIERAKVLGDLSLIALSDEKKRAARRYFTQALRLAEKTSDASAQAYALFCAAEFYYFPDDNKSLEYLKKSVEFWKQAGDEEGEATSLVRLGYVYMDKYEYVPALEVLNTALSKWETLGNLRGQAFTHRAIATVLNLSDDKQKALEYYKRAEQLIPKNIDYFEQAGMYNGFGFLYESYGDWKLSIAYREKALELFRKDKHIYGQLATIVSLCKLQGLNGSEDAVLNYYNQGKQLSAQLNESLYSSMLEEELGNFYLQRGELEKARLSYGKALRFFNEKKLYRQVAQIKAELGVLSERRNDFSVARRYFSQSLKLSRKVRDTFAETETLFQLAKIAMTENKDETALQLAENAIALTESLYSDVLNTNLRKTYFSNSFARYELYINLLMKRHRQFPEKDFAVQALQASEKARARSMLETLSLAEINFTKDADPELVKRENEIRSLLNVKANKITDLYNRNVAKNEIDKAFDEMNVLTHQLEDIKAVLKQNSPLYADIKNPPPFDIAAFQNRILDDRTLLLEFSFGTEQSYLWLIGKNEFSVYELPGDSQLEARLQKLRQLLAAREALPEESIEDYQTRTTLADDEYWREAQILSDTLFGQIAGKMANKRLVIVADGKLQYFPVAALPFPRSNSREPILLTNEIVYEPSASTLLLLAKDAKKTDDAQKNLLVVADPVFSKEDSRFVAAVENKNEAAPALSSINVFRSGGKLNSFQRLFASKDEAGAIIEVVGGDSKLAEGFAANRELVLNPEISQYKMIHFATHGFLDENRPELSSLILSSYDEQGNDRDGVVRLNDIYGLNLTADLIVLSACNTGNGKEFKGEGLMSLDNAFLQVGAKSVVSSLWKVDDYATKELMKNFYQELIAGNVTTAEALQRAQIKLRANPRYQSPFYWAAFTVKGNFRSTPQISKTFWHWFYLSGLLPFLLFGGYLYFRRAKLSNREIVNNR